MIDPESSLIKKIETLVAETYGPMNAEHRSSALASLRDSIERLRMSAIETYIFRGEVLGDLAVQKVEILQYVVTLVSGYVDMHPKVVKFDA